MQRIIRVAVGALMILLAAPPLALATPAPDTTPGPDTTPAPDTTPVPDTTSGSFAVQPSGPNGPGGRDYFVYTLSPGAKYRDTVGISNLGSDPVTFAIYAVDAQNTTDGSFSLVGEDAAPTGVGSWIDLGATQYTVEPGTRIDVPFQITVPADVPAGDHVGGIVAQPIDDAGDPDDGIDLDVQVRIGARVYVRVDGPVSPSLTVDELTLSYSAPASPLSGRDARVAYTLRNTGNVRLSPTAAVTVTGALGWGDRSLPDRLIPELLPGGSVRITEIVHDVRPFIRLTADLTVTDHESVSINTSVSEWAVPRLTIGILVMLLAGMLAWSVVRRRRAGAGR